MKFLIDMNLPPEWVNIFEQHGWHAVHWKEIGEPNASDNTIMAWARQHDYVVFTRDLDFGMLLAMTFADGPSVIQVRVKDVMPRSLGNLLMAVLREHQSAIESGALLTITEDRTRVRILPFKVDSL
jgi:predicted nuclease of predicted toxin-antitoxin system